MFGGKAKITRERALAGLGGVLLLVALLAAYANHFHNSFHFDDAHTIETNAAIRELRNIPLFFRDATTFSSLPSNQSYRPLVSTLFAVDYRLGGLHPLWFHLSIFALFVALTLLLAFVIHRLLDDAASSARNSWIALAAAAWYGLHPANADTINYIIASAEVISTLGVIASFAVYFAFPRLRRYHLYVLPAAIAILAKPPAAIFAALFAIYSLLFPPDDARLTEARLQGRALAYFAETIPSFVICGATLLFVQHMTPHSWIAGAANVHNYLITQPYVALLYLKTFFWPSGLSADYDLNPFMTAGDPRFWSGFAFIAVLATMSIFAARFNKTRMISFGLLWFLIALLPTSLFPLAEVMNDHRTFLPYVGIVIAMAGTAALLLINCRVAIQSSGKNRGALRACAVPLCKRIRHVSTKQSLENRGNALARCRDQESGQRTRVDELWEHADGQRGFRRRSRLFPSRTTAHATVFRVVDQSCDCGRCDEAERGGGATFQGCPATRAGKPRQLHLLCALPALARACR
jgi:hypothetical protein